MRLHTLLAFAIALAVATPARAETVVVPVGTVLSAETLALQKLVVRACSTATGSRVWSCGARRSSVDP